MEYLIGLILALAIAGASAIFGFDRDRAFYPTVLIVIASYYVLFALRGATGGTMVVELIAASGFLLAAVIGFKRNLWLVVIALIGHGVFDFAHRWFIENPGVPDWWFGFCLTFDVTIGAYLAVLLMRRSNFFDSQGTSARRA
jgi:hypothetical protein